MQQDTQQQQVQEQQQQQAQEQNQTRYNGNFTLTPEEKAQLGYILRAGEREIHSTLAKIMLCPYILPILEDVPYNKYAVQNEMNAFLSGLLGNACTTAFSGVITYEVGYDTVTLRDRDTSRSTEELRYTLTLQKPQLRRPNQAMINAERGNFNRIKTSIEGGTNSDGNNVDGITPSAAALPGNLTLLEVDLNFSYSSTYIEDVFNHNQSLIITLLGIFNYTSAALFLVPGISISGYLLASYLDGSLLASQILESQLAHAAFGLLGVGGFLLAGAGILHIVTYQQMSFPADFDFQVDAMAQRVQNFVNTAKTEESQAFRNISADRFNSTNYLGTLTYELAHFTSIRGLVNRPEPVQQQRQ